MRRIELIAALILIPSLASATTVSRSQLRDANERVAHAQRQARIAVSSGDAASAAVARATLKAARAKAWAIEHPAPVPVASAGVR